MSYTTPPTFVADTILTAADQNILSDDIAYLKAQTDQAVLSGTLVKRVGTQSIPNNTNTSVSFTSEVFDAGGWIAVTSTTVTVPAGAIPAGFTTIALDVRASVAFATNTTGYRGMTVYQNGTVIMSRALDASASTVVYLEGSEFTTAVSGDTIHVDVYQNSGAALNVTASLSVAVFKPVS